MRESTCESQVNWCAWKFYSFFYFFLSVPEFTLWGKVSIYSQNFLNRTGIFVYIAPDQTPFLFLIDILNSICDISSYLRLELNSMKNALSLAFYRRGAESDLIDNRSFICFKIFIIIQCFCRRCVLRTIVWIKVLYTEVFF